MAIQKANREKIENHIRNREPFKIANMSAGYRPAFTGSGAFYTVYSYETEMLVETAGKEILLNNKKYSPTTTNHQHIIRAALTDTELEQAKELKLLKGDL